VRNADIRGEFLGEERQTTVGFSKTAISSTSLAISSEALVVRPTLLYSRPIIQSLVAFTLTPKYVTLSDSERSFYVKFCFFVKFKICFFPYTERAIISTLGIDNNIIFGEGTQVTCVSRKLLNILRLGIFNSFCFLKSI